MRAPDVPGAPLTYDRPEERARRANSHFCDATGSVIFCLEDECPHCDHLEEGDLDER
jgi:hypothetical protein